MKIPLAIDEIEVPRDVQVSIDQDVVTVTGPKGELRRSLSHPRIDISPEDGRIVVRCEMPRKREKALVGTYGAHLRNMIRGVTQGFTYRLKVVYAHFPIKVSVKGREVHIDNFLGEQYPRKANIFGDVQVNVKGDTITVEGINREEVGQTAANIERAVRVRRRDIRIFQDGAYITSKDRGA
ncbi:MAG TPA: 50S ribosomal protein L6 [Thermoplasmatales archaeon]|nr:50S ribosomal protein L6 [Candidatus Thermoplasmatota archaeon]MDD5778079.1 50S ribosomal protein L6 [Candidatus Thermoplasmatota archaeon]HDS58917.1 50S ribosomal protein L6 [Thermoplasmatales archaeon]